MERPLRGRAPTVPGVGRDILERCLTQAFDFSGQGGLDFRRKLLGRVTMPRRTQISVIVLFAQLLIEPALGQLVDNACGSLDNAYGPFDFTDSHDFKENLPVVEKFHYDAGVQQLRGHSGKPNPFAYLPHDIDYTLRAFPNHHPALYTMIRYHLEKVPQGAPPMRYTAACYLDRARRFAPNDPVVVMLEGIYLHKTGDLQEAVSRYELATKMAPNAAEAHYNAGLVHLDLGSNQLALEHAKRAYELGFPLPGLKKELTRLGLWD